MSEEKQDTPPVGERARRLSDDELNAHILARLEALGIDLDVLPEDDPEAPADRRRILKSARRFLRNTPARIADFEMGREDGPATLYPTALRDRVDGSGP